MNETSTSASVIFRTRPGLSFAECVSRLETALRGSFQDTMHLTWDHEDVVLIDIDGSRVMLGFWQAPEAVAAVSGTAAILVLSVGPGPDWQVSSRLAPFARELCKTVIDGMVERHNADAVLWKDFQGVVTPDDFDMLIDQALEAAHSAGAGAGAGAGAEEAQAAVHALAQPRIAPRTATQRGAGARRHAARHVRHLMDEIAHKAEADHDRDAATRPQIELPGSVLELDMEAANDTPDLPAPQRAELDRIRLALYPPHEAPEVSARPLPQRLSIYAANTTLMLVALPVGAALLTYNLLGGEDSRNTARAMGLTGALLALSQTSFGHALLPLLG